MCAVKNIEISKVEAPSCQQINKTMIDRTGVVLQQLVHSDVPDFHRRVGAGSRDARATRVKLDVVDEAAVLVERVHALS